MNPGLANKVLNDPAIDRPLEAAAAPIAARLVMVTPRDTGRTASRVWISSGHRGADGRRRAVRVNQGGAAVHQHFSNGRNRGYMLRAI